MPKSTIWWCAAMGHAGPSTTKQWVTRYQRQWIMIPRAASKYAWLCLRSNWLYPQCCWLCQIRQFINQCAGLFVNKSTRNDGFHMFSPVNMSVCLNNRGPTVILCGPSPISDTTKYGYSISCYISQHIPFHPYCAHIVDGTNGFVHSPHYCWLNLHVWRSPSRHFT